MKYLENASVFLIDDEPAILFILSDLLEEIGVRSQNFGKATDAIETITNEMPDLIITDHKMPGMDGMEFLNKLREKKIDTPVIFISAHISKEMMINAIELGVYGFIEKPIREIPFKTIVKNALAKSLFQKLMKKKISYINSSFDKLNTKYNADKKNSEFENIKNELLDLELMNKNYTSK